MATHSSGNAMENEQEKCGVNIVEQTTTAASATVEEVTNEIVKLVVDKVEFVTDPEQVVVCFNTMYINDRDCDNKQKKYYQAFLMFYMDSKSVELSGFTSDNIVGEGESFYRAAVELLTTLEMKFNTIEKEAKALEAIENEFNRIKAAKDEQQKKLQFRKMECMIKGKATV
jgi:hypothetical protein